MKFYCNINEKKILNILKKNPHTSSFFCTYNNSFINHSLNNNFNNNFNKKNNNKKNIKYEKKFLSKNCNNIKELDPNKFIFDNYYANLNQYSRLLTSDFPTYIYKPICNRLTSTIHWGQRKLLFSELEFLMNYSTGNELIVYAGAAPGNHISILVEMFPNHDYILIDPREFNENLKNIKNITLINSFLDEKLSKELKNKYKNKNILLISDIRTSDSSKKGNNFENEVYNNLKLQEKFHLLLKPKYSSLKFRLPWNKENIKYLEGDIYFQIWEGVDSTETRLIIGDKLKNKNYNIKKYEENLSYFNRITRVQYYKHNYEVKHMDHCYDCYTEFLLLENYYKKFNTKYFNPTQQKYLKNINKKFNKNLSQKKFVELSSQYITDFLTQEGKNHFFPLDYEIIE